MKNTATRQPQLSETTHSNKKFPKKLKQTTAARIIGDGFSRPVVYTFVCLQGSNETLRIKSEKIRFAKE